MNQQPPPNRNTFNAPNQTKIGPSDKYLSPLQIPQPGPMTLVENLIDLSGIKESVLVTCPYCKFTGMTLVKSSPDCTCFLFCCPVFVDALSHFCSRCRVELNGEKVECFI